MTMQFSLPAEIVAAAKETIARADRSKPEPTDADVVEYVTRSLFAGLTSLFPGVVIASQADAAAQIAALTADLEAATLAALNVQVVA